MKTKVILWSVVSILIIGIAAAGILWLRRPQVIQLDKNTKLTLLGVDYGKHHKFPAMKITGQRGGGGPTSFDTTNDTLVIWILQEHKLHQYPNYQVMVYDKATTACVGNWGNGNMRHIKNDMEVMGVQLAAFPRREGKIYLRIAAWNNNGGGMKLAVISNPVHGKFFPNWTPEPLPDTQSDGDLDVTLTRLNFGNSVSFGGFGNGRQPKNDPMNKAVQVAFHTEQKGVVVTNWQPVRIETSDVTGNDVQNNSWSNGRDDNGDATMTYQWGLWPDEAAWKLRVEMSRTSGFKEDELWSVTNVPVNPGHQQDLWNYNGLTSRTNSAFAETTLNGIHLKLFPAIQITDQNFGNGQKQGGIRVAADPDLPEGFRLSITATDEQGHELQSWGPNGGGGNYIVQFPDIRNAKSLKIAVALHKSRFVEFTVKPAKNKE